MPDTPQDTPIGSDPPPKVPFPPGSPPPPAPVPADEPASDTRINDHAFVPQRDEPELDKCAYDGCGKRECGHVWTADAHSSNPPCEPVPVPASEPRGEDGPLKDWEEGPTGSGLGGAKL
jgi:hypothetical protein